MSSVFSSVGNLDFPPRREGVRGEWAPLFLEPIVGSGERICIGIAAVNGKDSLVVPVVALDRLECLYGKQVEALLLASRITLDYTQQVLRKDGKAALRSWHAPADGIYIGGAVPCEGDSLEEIARTGLTASSSLVDKLADAEAERAGVSEGITTSRLEELVKQRVVSALPMLERRFRVQRKIRENARPSTIGFIGEKIAANFGMLLPGKLSPLVDVSKAKLWDLAQLRQDVRHDMFSAPLSRFELLIYRPRDEAPEYSERQLKGVQEAFVELEAEADKIEIRCRPSTTHEQMADVILEAEAA